MYLHIYVPNLCIVSRKWGCVFSEVSLKSRLLKYLKLKTQKCRTLNLCFQEVMLFLYVTLDLKVLFPRSTFSSPVMRKTCCT